MRGLIVLATAALTATSPAFADDLAAIPTIVPAAPFSWTGCYIGGNFGFGVGDDGTTGLSGTTTNFSATGFMGGGQIGCDHQLAPRWVVGVEGQADWTNLNNTRAGTVRYPAIGLTVPSQDTINNDFLATLTVRLGYSIVDHVLVFAKGGAAWTDEKYAIAFTIPPFSVRGLPPQGFAAADASATRTLTGWTIGTGLDWAFAPHWSATLEYDYYDFGDRGELLTDPNTTVNVYSLKDRINTVTVGVNYHF
jgi:outer membrane immunogenic protein